MDDQQNVSNRDLILEMHGDIKQILAAQAATNAKLDAHIKEDDDKHNKVDADIDGLKAFRSKLLGYAAAVSFAIGLMVSLAKDALASAIHWGR